ncbi:MAG: F0F1 ATP synthase subunit delta [Actinomycetes bacterium]
MSVPMQGASRESLGAARGRLDALLSAGSGTQPLPVGEQLYSVVDFLDDQPAVRAALTDPSRSATDKAQLFDTLFRDKIDGATQDLVGGIVRERWSRPRDLADALADLGLQAVATAAERRQVLDSLEDDLFRFGQIVAGSPQLRSALTDRAVPAVPKQQLVDDLLRGKASPEAALLLGRVVVHQRGRSLEDGLADLIEEVAERRRRTTATVVAAIPLTEQQRERLAASLSAQRGTQVHLNVVVDPEVVGGLKITIGDEVVDGTLATRLDEARRRLAG